MTTTAEKIKVMQAFEDGQKIEFIKSRRKDDTRPATRGWVEWGETWEEPIWDWDFCDYRIKPPDPEPLEFRANQYKDGNIVAFTNIDTAMLVAQQNDAPRQAVLVREVTPQDEENEKDAARYRWLKENGYNDTRVLWKNLSEWDGIIDKAMEQT